MKTLIPSALLLTLIASPALANGPSQQTLQAAGNGFERAMISAAYKAAKRMPLHRARQLTAKAFRNEIRYQKPVAGGRSATARAYGAIAGYKHQAVNAEVLRAMPIVGLGVTVSQEGDRMYRHKKYGSLAKTDKYPSTLGSFFHKVVAPVASWTGLPGMALNLVTNGVVAKQRFNEYAAALKMEAESLNLP